MGTIYYDRLLDQLLRAFSALSSPDVACPARLYHYTTHEAFPKIISDDRLRAYSADSQNKDKTEITQGCELLGELLDAKSKSAKLSDFTRELLQQLKPLPYQRRPWIFLACFSTKRDNVRLWEKFRSGYCLSFEADQSRYKCVAAPRGLASGQGFASELVPIIYDRKKQKKMLIKALNTLIGILENRSIIQGPFFESYRVDMARFSAITIAEFLLALIVRFKSKKKFSEEYEWRVVARPDHTKFSSDPLEADRNCGCYIKKDEARRYIEMSGIAPEVLIRPGEPIFGLDLRSPKLPIREVVIGPKLGQEELFNCARVVLSDWGYGDVLISRSSHTIKIDSVS